MSKGLEALKRIKPYADSSIDGELDTIEKELKVLEIIKRAYDDGDLSYDDDTNTYYYLGIEITKEESKLLWGVFHNAKGS